MCIHYIGILYTHYIIILHHLTITDSDFANSYNSEKELVSVFNNNNNENMLTMLYVNKNKTNFFFIEQNCIRASVFVRPNNYASIKMHVFSQVLIKLYDTGQWKLCRVTIGWLLVL